MDIDEYAENCLIKELIVNSSKCDPMYWYEFHTDDQYKKLKEINLNYSLLKFNQLITFNWEICSTIKKLLINFYPYDQQIDIYTLFNSINNSLKNLEYLELINFKKSIESDSSTIETSDKKNLIILELNAPQVRTLYLSNNEFNLRIKSTTVDTLYIDYLFSKVKFENLNQLKYLELNDYHKNAFNYKNLQIIKINNVISLNDEKNPANEIRNLVDLEKLKFIYLDQIPYFKDLNHNKLLDVMNGPIQRLLRERSIAIKENDLRVFFKSTELIGRKPFIEYPVDQILGNIIDFTIDGNIFIDPLDTVNENIQILNKQIEDNDQNDKKDDKQFIDIKENEFSNSLDGDEIIDCVYYENTIDSVSDEKENNAINNISKDKLTSENVSNEIKDQFKNNDNYLLNNESLNDKLINEIDDKLINETIDDDKLINETIDDGKFTNEYLIENDENQKSMEIADQFVGIDQKSIEDQDDKFIDSNEDLIKEIKNESINEDSNIQIKDKKENTNQESIKDQNEQINGQTDAKETLIKDIKETELENESVDFME